MMNNKELYYLSGLLHDIGKFYQRADDWLEKSTNLAESSKKIADYICPKNNKGNYAYQHVIWSYDFIEKFRDKFSKLGLSVNVFDSNAATANQFINLVAYHHQPNTPEQAIIQLADWWASGIDRTQSQDYNNSAVETFKAGFKEKTILNIFSHIIANGEKGQADDYLEVDELHLGQLTKGKVNSNSREQYEKLWKKFTEEFAVLPDDSLKNFNYSLTYLLKKYTWLIPASTIDFPDNSLFDHLKLTAAFSQILYEYYTTSPESFDYNGKKLIINQECFPVSMGCADISGIQNFIYNISSKYAAKSLKGRSFYLQLLIETVQHQLMDKLGLQPGHFIYSSGGKMFFLFANTAANHQLLQEIKNECEAFLWNAYKGSLSVNLAAVNFSYDTDEKINIEGSDPSDLGTLWSNLTQKVSTQKNTKFKNIYLEKFNELFKPHEVGGRENVCAVTGEELTQHNRAIIDKDDTENLYVSKQVSSQIKLGKALKGGVVTLLTNKEQFAPSVKAEHLFYDILPFGFKAAVLSQQELSNLSSADHVVCIKTLETDNNTFTNLLKGKDIRYGFRLYGGYDAPVNNNNDHDKNEYKTFEQLAGENGYNKLGVLRMDVDSLGQLFINGFEPVRKSFSAYATLSGMLDWFFSGYLNTIRAEDAFKDDVQIIYAGGDDLFAVGRWEKIIDFADTVNTSFKAFTGRSDISVSGGVSIVDAKFPIAKAADMAGEAEDKAKDHKYAETDKNAICIFGVPVNWDKEYPVVKSWQNDFSNWLDNGTITKGLLMKFFDYYEIYKNNKTNNSWKWNLMYQIARRIESFKQNETAKKDALNKIQLYWLEHIASGKTPMQNFIVACRWAELRNRKKNK